MELTERTLTILRNYATINPNIVIAQGNTIRTASEIKTIYSSAEIDNEFPLRFGIYDLSEFLNAVSLVDSPRLIFDQSDDYVVISDGSGRSRIRYYFSALENFAQHLTKDINIKMPEADVKFTLDKETLSKIKRASSVLGHSTMSVSVVDDVLRISVIDSSDETSNVFSIDVDSVFESQSFNFIFDISNLKMIDGDYEVSLSKKLISKFVNKESSISYWVAMEKNSTYEE